MNLIYRLKKIFPAPCTTNWLVYTYLFRFVTTLFNYTDEDLHKTRRIIVFDIAVSIFLDDERETQYAEPNSSKLP
jgi:hypothetical protein